MWNKPVITIWNPRKNFKKCDMKMWTPDFLAFNRYVSMISISFDCSACCNILWNDICISFLYVFKNKLFYSLPKNMLLNDRKKHYKLHFVFAQHSNNYNNHPKYTGPSVCPSICLSVTMGMKKNMGCYICV